MKRTTLLLSLLLVLAFAGGSPAKAQPFHTGFLDNNAFYDVEPETGDGWLERARESGASYIRLNVYWDTIAPAERPPGFNPSNPNTPGYDWTLLDQSVKSTVKHDMVPILMAFLAPKWAEGPTPDPKVRPGTWKPDPTQFAAFGRALALRYGGNFPDPNQPGSNLPKVRYLQAWNEPNLNYYLNPQTENGQVTSPDLYRPLLNRFYRSVKSVAPDVRILAAGIAPLGGIKNVAIAPLRFIRKLTCLKRNLRPKSGCKHAIKADIFDIHLYTSGGPTHQAASVDEVALGDLPELKRTLDAADRYSRIQGRYRHTRLWSTEFSWDTSPPDPGGLPMWLAKRWVAEALYRMWQSGISVMTWSGIVDDLSPLPGAQWEWLWAYTVQSGFYFYSQDPASATKKGSLQAFRFPFVAFRTDRGFRFWGRTPDSKGGKVRIQQNSGSGWKSVMNVRADKYGLFSQKVRTRDRTGKVRAIYAGSSAVPFSLRNVPDRYFRPFGGIPD